MIVSRMKCITLGLVLIVSVLAEPGERIPNHPNCPEHQGPMPVYFAHPTNCSRFFECRQKDAWEFECSAGLHFNSKIDVCDYPANAQCEPQSMTTTTNSPTTLVSSTVITSTTTVATTVETTPTNSPTTTESTTTTSYPVTESTTTPYPTPEDTTPFTTTTKGTTTPTPDDTTPFTTTTEGTTTPSPEDTTPFTTTTAGTTTPTPEDTTPFTTTTEGTTTSSPEDTTPFTTTTEGTTTPTPEDTTPFTTTTAGTTTPTPEDTTPFITTTEGTTTTQRPPSSNVTPLPECPPFGATQPNYWADGTDCSRYLGCLENCVQEFKCPGELLWNDQQKQCDSVGSSNCCPVIPPAPNVWPTSTSVYKSIYN